MRLSQLVKARELIKKQPWLIWSTRNFAKLDAAAITEAILSYGDWQDFLNLKKIFGLKQLKAIFRELTNKKRVNLRSSTVNLFNLYFQHYAS